MVTKRQQVRKYDLERKERQERRVAELRQKPKPDSIIMPHLGEIRRGVRQKGNKDKLKRVGRKSKWIQYIWIECPICLKQRWVHLYTLRSEKYTGVCSSCLLARIRKKQSEVGHTYVANGYAFEKIAPGSPFYPMANKQGFIAQHRLVIAQQLGRCLKRWEIVHHKNRIKLDNRPQNLELIENSGNHNMITLLQSRVDYLERKLKEAKVDF